MSTQIPQKSSLVTETARVISERIISGEWQTTLPGERYLSRVLEVGRDTVRRALISLEKTGWVSGTDKGRKRRILRTSPAPRKRGRKSLRSFTVGFLTSVPLDRMNPSTLFEIYKIEEALAARNALLKVVVGSWAAKNHPEDHLRELFDREKCSLWILHRSSRETQQWFHKNDIPSLIRGLAHENIPLPQLDVDWEATARHASASLWRSGHRNVAIIAPVEKLRGIVAACNGALGFQGEDWKAHIITDSGERSGLVQKLNTFFNDHPEVTALITTRSRQVITLWGWAGARGLRIPRDISVISLASEYFMQDFYPKVSYYDVNNEQISRRVIRSVMRIMEGHSISRNSEWLIPDYFPGGSIQTINSPS